MSRDLVGYRLIEPIGRGAAGTVYSAEYGKLRRPVAIKILHRHLLTDGSGARMLAEARTLSLLDHPGIVKVFDVGTARDGRVYMVMEQLVGEPLHHRLRSGALAEDRVLMFGRQLASALEVTHSAGIVHRDLKPANVFVVADPDLPGGERVKLFDFGIAKHVQHTLTGVDPTATGVVLGTPAYMAPERFHGSRGTDPRADVYSLGVVLYLMATGNAPFGGSDTDELAAEHAYCRPTAPTVAGVSKRLSEVIERCLAKSPDDRYATMAEVGEALRDAEAPSQFDDAATFVCGTRFNARTLPMRMTPRLRPPSRPPPLPKLVRVPEPLLPRVPAPLPVAPQVRSKTVCPKRRPIRLWVAVASAAVVALALVLVIQLRTEKRLERAAHVATPLSGTIDLSGVAQAAPAEPSMRSARPALPARASARPKRPKKAVTVKKEKVDAFTAPTLF